MRKIVLKYRTELPGGVAKVPMGYMSKIVAIQVQNGYITVWVEHLDTVKITHTKDLVAVPTGVDFEADGLTHLQTVQSGGYVWHVYEKEA